MTELRHELVSGYSDRVENKIKISVVIVSMDGKVLGMDENARCNKPWLNLT